MNQSATIKIQSNNGTISLLTSERVATMTMTYALSLYVNEAEARLGGNVGKDRTFPDKGLTEPQNASQDHSPKSPRPKANPTQATNGGKK